MNRGHAEERQGQIVLRRFLTPTKRLAWDPTDAYAYEVRAVAELHLGDDRYAADDHERAIKLDPTLDHRSIRPIILMIAFLTGLGCLLGACYNYIRLRNSLHQKQLVCAFTFGIFV